MHTLGTNIIHKAIMRIANLVQVIGGFEEANRHRIPFQITANNTAVNVFVAPFKGRVESLIVSSPTPTVSSSGNSVTATVRDVTASADIISFDTFVSGKEITPANTGTEYDSFPAVDPSFGVAAQNFAKGDVISLKLQVTGTPGPTSGTVMNGVLTLVPVDKNFAF